MSLKAKITNTADRIEGLLDDVIKRRNAAKGEEKRRLRHVSKSLDDALTMLEKAEQETGFLEGVPA